MATVRVSRESTLQIATDELAAVLVRAGQREVAGELGAAPHRGRFVEFEALRAQAIDVRYDAATDQVVVSL